MRAPSAEACVVLATRSDLDLVVDKFARIGALVELGSGGVWSWRRAEALVVLGPGGVWYCLRCLGVAIGKKNGGDRGPGHGHGRGPGPAPGHTIFKTIQ